MASRVNTTIPQAHSAAPDPAASGAARPIRVAILDDYQRVARRFADWGSLPEGSELKSPIIAPSGK